VRSRRLAGLAAMVIWLVAGARCRREGSEASTPPSPASAPSTPTAPPPPPAPPKPDPDALPIAEGLPPERRAIQVVHGQERVVDAELARERGLTIADLSDPWAPFIFQDATAPDGAVLPNRYRSVFVGLANDRSDGDGQPLRPGERNYLELYGIPPSLSVLRERFLADAAHSCEGQVDNARLLAVDGIETWGASTEKKELSKARARADRLESARLRADAGTLEAVAAASPKLARDLAAQRRFEAERASFAEVEKRLACEGLMDPAKHKPGLYDTAMRFAMLDFQQKNIVMAQGDITRGTLEALARPPLENAFAAFRRVLAERAAHAGGFLEDGSVLPAPGSKSPAPTYEGADGGRVPVPDLVGAATSALLERLGLATAQDALAFFKRHARQDFRWLKVAVRFPEPPPYYGPHMDLSAEIDRGDIWYDFPFDPQGRRLPQPRAHYPAFTLYVRWKGERVPLVRWRTTIGGWRSELAADGEEYLRYKDSDVGPRVWRHVVAAPVWIPPPSSPLGSMVKTKWVNGAMLKVTNYDEVGPGYLSAYGLVAGIHVETRKRPEGTTYFDNGIRTHGTFDYTSLRGRFSHGCHRLQNNMAVRLFSFVLRHRKMKVLGPMALDFRRSFWADGEVFDMRLPTRGFYYELDPPLPVETLEGEIKGTLAKPVAGYVRKPGVTYANGAIPPVAGGPESKAGGAAGEAAAP
jgi:hypothetical protein